MTEVDAMEFYQKLSDSTDVVRETTLTHRSNAELTVELHPINRTDLLDYISMLPDEMLDTIADAEDEAAAQQAAEEQNMLAGVDGRAVTAFENICADSMYHEDLTTHHFEDMVAEFDFELLFELGAEIIELSFEDTGTIEDFREPDSARNS